MSVLTAGLKSHAVIDVPSPRVSSTPFTVTVWGVKKFVGVKTSFRVFAGSP
jgi:hypothetical protein